MNLQFLLIVLTAALIVVFVALVFLSVRVGQYGGALRSLQSRLSGEGVVPAGRPAAPAGSGKKIPGEILAVLAAAAYCMVPGARITAVRRASAPERKRVPCAAARKRSPWANAGVLENTRPF